MRGPADHETAWRRIRKDIGRALRSVWFAVGAVVASAVAAVVTFPFIEDDSHSITARALMAGTTVLLGLWIALGVVALMLAARTPYRQRDEARHQRDLLAYQQMSPAEQAADLERHIAEYEAKHGRWQ